MFFVYIKAIPDKLAKLSIKLDEVCILGFTPALKTTALKIVFNG